MWQIIRITDPRGQIVFVSTAIDLLKMGGLKAADKLKS